MGFDFSGWERSLDYYKTTPPDDEKEVAMECCMCGKELYVGDEVYLVEDNAYCTDCMSDCKHQIDEDDVY